MAWPTLHRNSRSPRKSAPFVKGQIKQCHLIEALLIHIRRCCLQQGISPNCGVQVTVSSALDFAFLSCSQAIAPPFKSVWLARLPSTRSGFSAVFLREHVRVEIGDPLLAFLRDPQVAECIADIGTNGLPEEGRVRRP